MRGIIRNLQILMAICVGAQTFGQNVGGTFGVVQKTREGPRVIQFGLKFLF